MVVSCVVTGASGYAGILGVIMRWMNPGSGWRRASGMHPPKATPTIQTESIFLKVGDVVKDRLDPGIVLGASIAHKPLQFEHHQLPRDLGDSSVA